MVQLATSCTAASLLPSEEGKEDFAYFFACLVHLLKGDVLAMRLQRVWLPFLTESEQRVKQDIEIFGWSLITQRLRDLRKFVLHHLHLRRFQRLLRALLRTWWRFLALNLILLLLFPFLVP